MNKYPSSMEEVVLDYLSNDVEFKAFYLNVFAKKLDKPYTLNNLADGLIAYLKRDDWK